MTTLYGIPNCDTVKKARKWLEAHGVAYDFHDVRADGITESQVRAWIDELGWETLINKRSTSWKDLSDEARAAMDADSARAAILAAPTLIKRPLLDHGGVRRVGFKESDYAALFGA